MGKETELRKTLQGYERLYWEANDGIAIYVNGKPWCIAGDINVTLYPNEHSSGNSVMTPDMMEFQDCLNIIKVEDICKSGLHFTRTKNVQRTKAGNKTGILKKLDRVMSNEDSSITFKKKIKAFRFSNFLTDKQEFLPIVKEKWSKEVKGFHMYQVVQKMKSLKSPLNNLGWCKGSLFKRVVSLRDELKRVQIDIDKDPHNTILKYLEAKLVKEFYVAEADEEKFLSQQAKIKWLSEGDKTSNYFHKVLKGRSIKSKILSLTDAKGGYYKEDQIPQKISNEIALNMIANVSDSEIKRAMFDIEDSKAPGPNGFTAAFFKKAWRVIGNDVCKAVNEFFSSGRMLGEINATLISLIPNVETPNKVTNFRPIACCNVLYKCISKVITNRIKFILGILVSNNQCAFILGRSIQDNILLTPEIMKRYNRKGVPKRVVVTDI
ncbi:RNA-directed DNA polymerase, eukaryota, reverse transcriptase zinc-binding domain protein [Tanacetum coccineum]|uniref:RNA-directed DNA polymerase, eukaryota, reverse transcriptase zinc-binding domain protein n=1 Tax=Tanacetum coccineum TaxID=301880 RepID=A0ABQ5BKH9_9ASTR